MGATISWNGDASFGRIMIQMSGWFISLEKKSFLQIRAFINVWSYSQALALQSILKSGNSNI